MTVRYWKYDEINRVHWNKTRGGRWYDFWNADLSSLGTSVGVYVIGLMLPGERYRMAVYVGEGKIRERLRSHRAKIEFKRWRELGRLVFTWIEVAPKRIAQAIETHLRITLRPCLCAAYWRHTRQYPSLSGGLELGRVEAVFNKPEGAGCLSRSAEIGIASMTNEVLYVLAGFAVIMIGCSLYLRHQLKLALAREAEEVKAPEATRAGDDKVRVFREIILKRKHPVTETYVIYVPLRRKI